MRLPAVDRVTMIASGIYHFLAFLRDEQLAIQALRAACGEGPIPDHDDGYIGTITHIVREIVRCDDVTDERERWLSMDLNQFRARYVPHEFYIGSDYYTADPPPYVRAGWDALTLFMLEYVPRSVLMLTLDRTFDAPNKARSFLSEEMAQHMKRVLGARLDDSVRQWWRTVDRDSTCTIIFDELMRRLAMRSEMPLPNNRLYYDLLRLDRTSGMHLLNAVMTEAAPPSVAEERYHRQHYDQYVVTEDHRQWWRDVQDGAATVSFDDVRESFRTQFAPDEPDVATVRAGGGSAAAPAHTSGYAVFPILREIVNRHPDNYVYEMTGPGVSALYTEVLVALTLLWITEGRTIVLRLVDPGYHNTGISRSHPWRRFARQHGRVTPRMLVEYARVLRAVV